MSAGSNQRSEDQFLCSICLGVFTDPVSTPCGYNLCKSCITQHWADKIICECPRCSGTFHFLPSVLVFLVAVFLARYLTPQKPLELTEEMKQLLAQAELKKVQQYAVDVTLDPDTANLYLILSDDGKQVHDSDKWKNLPDNPQRFSLYIHVLGSQSFSSGRFYFEVQVKGKTDWALGVARESINRKGQITLSPQEGFWTVRLRNGNNYIVNDNPSVRLHLQSGPEKVGVFVDYEEGLVSFYDVDAAALIYSFTCCSFTEKLYPFFSPSLNDRGKNSAPLIISPVKKRV